MQFRAIADAILNSGVQISKSSKEELESTVDDQDRLYVDFVNEHGTIARLCIYLEAKTTYGEDLSVWRKTFSAFNLTIIGYCYDDSFEDRAKEISAICTLVQSLKDKFSFESGLVCIKTAEEIERDKRNTEICNSYKELIEQSFVKARLGKTILHDLAVHPKLKDLQNHGVMGNITLKFQHGNCWRVFTVTADTIFYSSKEAC